MENFIGIDLGTTYSAVSTIDEFGKPVILKNGDGDNLTPSVIYIDKNGRAIVGTEAKELLQSGEANVAMFFKRSMGNPDYRFYANDVEYTATELSAILLRKLKEDAELALHGKVEKAVITVPAYFNDLQRTETMKAAEMAGLEVMHIINEPTAAAITFGVAKTVSQKLLVYDLGGGTFDVTVLQVTEDAIQVLATGGDHELGGKDWDDRILSYVTTQFMEEFGEDPSDSVETYNDLVLLSEKLKKQLSSTTSASMMVRYNGYRKKYDLTRVKFEELTSSLLHGTQLKTEEVLAEVGLTWSQLAGVLLVGGSTKMPMIENWVREMSGKEPIRGVNVDEAVCMGAAIQAGMEMQHQYPQLSTRGTRFLLGTTKKIQDVMSHSLGAVAVSGDGSRYINSIIIPKNKPIPTTEKCPFKHRTRRNGDNELEIYLTQGEVEDISSCLVVGKYVFRDIQSVDNGETIIDIEYSYDNNGMIHVGGTQREYSKRLFAEKVALPEDMNWLNEEPRGKVLPMAIIIAIDLSGSMSGKPLQKAKEAAQAFVDKIDLSSSSVGLMGFADHSKMFSLLSHDKSEITTAIKKIDFCSSVGYGNNNNPLEDCCKIFRNDELAKNVVVVLTDGVWSCRNKALKTAEECSKAGIDIIAIGFGGADKNFLERIATCSENALMTNLDNLVQSFGNIAQVLTETSGRGGLRLK